MSFSSIDKEAARSCLNSLRKRFNFFADDGIFVTCNVTVRYWMSCPDTGAPVDGAPVLDDWQLLEKLDIMGRLAAMNVEHCW